MGSAGSAGRPRLSRKDKLARAVACCRQPRPLPRTGAALCARARAESIACGNMPPRRLACMRARTAAGEHIHWRLVRFACVRTHRYRRLCAAYFVAGMLDKKKLGAMVDLERSALALDTHLIQRLRTLVPPPHTPPVFPPTRERARTLTILRNRQRPFIAQLNTVDRAMACGSAERRGGGPSGQSAPPACVCSL